MGRKLKPPRRGRLWLRRAGWVLTALLVLSVALVLPLRWIDPPTSSFMLRDDSGRIPVAYEWADWEQISDAATLAVVAAEDQKFAEHLGFDLSSIADAIETRGQGGSLRGASTLTQQLAKNLYLWPGRNLVRKGLEAWFTLLLEACLPKRRIVEIYLNIAELGPGIYGVPAASRRYFGLEPGDLGDAQAALLAAVLPNPSRMQPDRPSDYVRERQQWIVGQMVRLRREGWITRLH